MLARALASTALLAAIASAACGAEAAGPPHLEEDRTACAHCGMLVSERLFAAAYRAPGGEARVFDDIRCLLKAVRKESSQANLEFWFHDAETLEWIEGTRAVIVHAPSLNTPMGGGMVAFATRAAAASAAGPHRGRVIGGIDELLKEGAR
jgi:copper chaperone NosL